MHCARLGRGLSAMPVDDIESIFTEIKRLLQTTEEFEVFDTPMFEIMNHPDPLMVFRRRAEILGCHRDCVISSSAHAIGKRADWREQLEGLKELGTEKFWLTIHGGGKVHDHYVGMPGAFSLVKEAVRRIHDVGLVCGTNVFLNSDNLAAFSELIHDVQSTGFDECYFDVAGYFPHARFRRYDTSRPTIEQITPHVKVIESMGLGSPDDRWANLTKYAESAWVEQALQATGEDAEIRWSEYGNTNVLELVALRNLDVHDGDLSFPARRYGNVKEDGLVDALARAKAAKADGTYMSPTDVRNFFGDVQPPRIAELALQVGDRTSRRAEFHPQSMRLRWLDRFYSDRRLL